jgi:hypothetical protein
MTSIHKFGARPVLATQRAEDFGPDHLRLAAIDLDGATAAFNGRMLDSNPHSRGTVEYTRWNKAYSDTTTALAAEHR